MNRPVARRSLQCLTLTVGLLFPALDPGLGGSAWPASSYGAPVAPSATIIEATLLPSVGSSIMDGSAFP